MWIIPPLPIAVYTGEELPIALANPAMIKTWGKGEDVMGKNYLEILPEIGKQLIFDQALGVFKTGTAFHAKDKKVELIIDGVLKTFYFNYSFIPLFDAEKNIYGVMNTGADVTDLHQAREQVQNSDHWLRMAVGSSGMGTYQIDLASKKITTCGNFNTIWSIEGEVTNEQLIARLHPEDQKLREEAHQQAQTTGKISYEARIVHDDGSLRWVKIDGKIIKDENGNPTTIIGIVRISTSRKPLSRSSKDRLPKIQRSCKDPMMTCCISPEW